MQDSAEIKNALRAATERRPARFMWLAKASDGEPLLLVSRTRVKGLQHRKTAKDKATIVEGRVYRGEIGLCFVCETGDVNPERMQKHLKRLARETGVAWLGRVVIVRKEDGVPEVTEGEEVGAPLQAPTERVPPRDEAPEGRAEPAPGTPDDTDPPGDTDKPRWVAGRVPGRGALGRARPPRPARGSPEPRLVRETVAALLQPIEPTLADAEARPKALAAAARKLDALARRLLRDRLAGKPHRDEDHAASERLQTRIPAAVTVVEGDLDRIAACLDRIVRVPGWEALVRGGTTDLDGAEAARIHEVERRVGRLRGLRAEIETALSTSRAALATCGELSTKDGG